MPELNMSHYLFLSERIELNQSLSLDSEWEVGLIKVVGFPSVSSVYCILSDRCKCSILNSRLLPVLRCVFVKRSVLKEVHLLTIYLFVSKTRIERVRIYIKDGNFEMSLNFKNRLN